jgi:2-dehydro-3-deoxyphosphogluconate aldolase / (4S)-4-hydroxy-2-oxoglutarate aldolase
MAQFTRIQVLNAIYDAGLVPVFYEKNLDTAKQIVEACVTGGARVIEFTNRGDFAYQVFADLVKHCRETHPEVILGVGSIIDAPTAALYIANGANFVVGPVLNPEVARLCNRRKVSYSPGCGSATEIQQAEELGVEIVKVFPGGEVGGPKFVKAVLGPTPWTAIMPTGGVEATEESISAWIKAGCAAVGIGGSLISKDLVQAGDFPGLAQKVSQCLWWVKKARGASVFLGVEHPGLYPNEDGGGEEMAQWYAETFGFEMKVGNSSIFVSGPGKGRLEIAKNATHDKAHVCVLVSNFEVALEQLRAKGFDFEEFGEKPGLKAAYLKGFDPAGHRVHLLWNPSVT